MWADAASCGHIVQLYQDQDLLGCAVSRLAGTGLANGNGIVLVSTLTRWNAIRIPARESLEQDIAELLPQPVRKPTHKPLVELKRYFLQVDNWKTDRNVECNG